ncbi:MULTISPECIES: TonB-dependent receptor [Ferrimonas]|uniref:TonB-dependent receptor n=1 Tax=Ferrimonas TaxID=44011 RepID=UPI0004856F82|nr:MULTISPECIES: TonB-dependent receptor [Ferrimonas]USD36423.1 TonB-dependent receptor [Ferrimonas sp. SCSIO 43195]
MTTHSTVSKAVRRAMLVAAGATAFTGFTTVAAEGEDSVERIEVTGSRIKRADMEGSSPVTVIDSSAISASGATSIDGVLQTLTAAGGAMTNPGINNGSGGNSRINLRGLGSQRTLVLVNGRRMIASGTGAASTVDLNTIPVSMVQRIEVLKDGASAVYGTDAVAGVVNIILKRDFEGFEMNAQYGMSGEGDAKESSIDFTLGTAFDKGHLVLGVQYTDRGEASQADRDFSKCPLNEAGDGSAPYCGGSSYAEGGHIWGDNNFGIVGTGPDGAYAIGDSGTYGGYVAKLDDAGNPVLDDDGNQIPVFEYHDGMSEADLSGRGGEYHDFTNADKYNYSATSYLFTPMQRINVTANGSYEVADNATFFSEVMYTKRWSEQQMAPQPIWNSEAWVYDPISAGGWMTDDLLPWVQPGEELSYGRRMSDTGNREFSQTVDTLRVVVGFEGEFDNGWGWDVSYNKGRNDSIDTLANLHNIGAINDAVQAGDFDPFLQSSWQGESIAPFIYTELNAGSSEMDIVAATLSGELFELPAGYVGFATGYEHRRESAKYTPDSLTAQGLANDPRVEPTSGSFTVDEAYVEFLVPVLSDMFLAENVELSAAARYFDYSTFGDDYTWKLGLTWRVNSDLMVRGVASTAYRAPTVDELYGGKSPSFDQITHPATDQTQAEVTVGGNELLTPEEADIYTVGVVYEPSFVDGLSLTLDYYNIEISNAISSVDSNYIANQCMDAGGNLINASTALCQASNIAIDGSGRISFDNGLQNLGGALTSGYDINIAYAFEAAGLDWRASLDTSILDEFEERDQDGNILDYTGYITSGSGAYAEFKSNFTLTAAGDDWSANYELRYIDGMDSFSCKDDPSDCYAPSVDSIVYHDISGAYHVTDTVTISGGINNLLDEEPPYYSGNNDSNTDPYTYDVLGRYFYVKAGVKF